MMKTTANHRSLPAPGSWTEILDRQAVKTTLARFDTELQAVDLKTYYNYDAALATNLTEEVCHYHRLVPLCLNSANQLEVAMANPFDMLAVQVLASKTGYPVVPYYCDSEDIDIALSRIFSREVHFEDTLQELVEVEAADESEAAEISIDLLRSEASDAPAVVFVNSLLIQAIQERASDIHLEPQENELRIRFRIDGLLKELPVASKRLMDAVVARIKILSSLDIAERRIPQDGRIKFRILGRSVDIRVSTIPGIYGEKIVMRILDKGQTTFNIDDLGLAAKSHQQLKSNVKASQGMILVTGPTGSGKTTTLYSLLNYINKPTLNILTVEDPVEYHLAGINQIQVKPAVGLSFASALRAFLRQDPDIIMVGEIRDLETAEIAIKAALTGHLVLSTLHTNNALATLTRLVNIGVAPYLVTASVSTIMAQRLVRRICLKCKTPLEPASGLIERFQSLGVAVGGEKFYTGTGCEQCSGTGYWGRLAIHEVLFMNGNLREMILKGASETELRKAVLAQGMRFLLDNGIDKARRGLTSLEEILRVL